MKDRLNVDRVTSFGRTKVEAVKASGFGQKFKENEKKHSTSSQISCSLNAE
jgi:hypothetical protein